MPSVSVVLDTGYWRIKGLWPVKRLQWRGKLTVHTDHKPLSIYLYIPCVSIEHSVLVALVNALVDPSQAQQKKAWKQEVISDIKQAQHQAECDREEIKKKIDTLTAEKETLQGEIAEVRLKAETDSEETKKKIDALTTENKALKKEITTVQQKAEIDRVKITTLEKQCENLRSENTRLKRENRLLNEELERERERNTNSSSCLVQHFKTCFRPAQQKKIIN